MATLPPRAKFETKGPDHAAATLALLASILGAFCWWGLFTESGSRHFDEMAGLIPFYAGIAGALALLLSLLLILWRTLMQRRR